MSIVVLPNTVLGTADVAARYGMHWNYAHNCLVSFQYNSNSDKYVCFHTRPTTESGTWDVARRVLVAEGSDWQFNDYCYVGPYSGYAYTSNTSDVNNQRLQSYNITGASATLVGQDARVGAALPACAYSICESRDADGTPFVLTWAITSSFLELWNSSCTLLTSINPAGVTSPGAIVCDLPPNASGNARWLVRTGSVAATITYIILTYNGTSLSESSAFSLTSANQSTYYGGPVLDSTGGIGGANQSNPAVFVDHGRKRLVIRRGSTTAGMIRVAALDMTTWLPVMTAHVACPDNDNDISGIGMSAGSQPCDMWRKPVVLVGGTAPVYPLIGSDFGGPFTYDNTVTLISAAYGVVLDSQNFEGRGDNLPIPQSNYYTPEAPVYDHTTGNVAAMAATTSSISNSVCRLFTLQGVVVDYVNDVDVVIPNIHWYIRKGVAEKAQALQKGPLVSVVNDNALLIQSFLSELVDANPTDDYQRIETDIDLNGHSLLNLNENTLDGLRYS